MEQKKLGAWAASSSNPEEVSNRIKGLILALSSVIILVAAQVFHVTLSPADVAQLGAQLGVIGGLLWSLWGAGVALVHFIATIRN